MNTDLLQRATFVLDRATAERLTTISGRLGVSRSSLVRDVLQEPIEMMDRWLAGLPDQLTSEDAAAALELVANDIGQWFDTKAAQFDLALEPADGHA